MTLKEAEKYLRREEREKNMREYTCPKCGYSAWALDHILAVTCRKCGTVVETKPVPVIDENEKSFVCDGRKHKRMA